MRALPSGLTSIGRRRGIAMTKLMTERRPVPRSAARLHSRPAPRHRRRPAGRQGRGGPHPHPGQGGNVKLLLSRCRAVAMLGLAAVVALVLTGAVAPSIAVGYVSPLTDAAAIQKLAADAYVWGSAPQFVYRFEKY